MSGLRLDLSINKDRFDAMEETYRNEGLSVGANHMRLYGEDIMLEVQISDLILGNKIGQGACSSVNVARHRRTGELYAIKMFNVYDKAQASQLYNEILLLTNIQCDTLITLKGVFHDEGSIGIIIEYMDKGSLEFIMDEHIQMNEQVMAAIAYQVLWGLGYLHYEKQLHRDVKPGNILMNSLGQVKLSDFGISKELDNSIAMSHTAVGSYRYMSPERLRADKYDAAGDIWSVGISLIELWEKGYPFRNIADTPISLLGELEKVNFSRMLSRSVVGYSKQMKEFILCTLEPDPLHRLGAADLMGSSWFEVTGVNSLPDAQMIVAQWVNAPLRGTKRGNDVSLNRSGNFRAAPPVASAAGGRPPRKDSNEMSISIESTRSALAPQHGGLPAHHQASLSSLPEDQLSISRELSRDRMGLSNNPFTSSGSFNFNNSASFSGTNSLTSNSGGVASFGPHGSGVGGASSLHNAATAAAASRYRLSVERGMVPEGDEYAHEVFEDDDEEDVHHYDYRGGYDYKQEEKHSGERYFSNRGHK